MVKAFFIADAHLNRDDAPGYVDLLAFLEKIAQARKADDRADFFYIQELFLLGDFFDFWFAKKDRFPSQFTAIVNKLAVLKKQGVQVHLCEGNHDFFLADFFTRHLGMTVYPDSAEINLDGRKVLIAHGDDFAVTDRGYRFLRSFLRSRFVYSLQKMLPLPLLLALAGFFSRLSREKGPDRTEELAGALHAFGREKMREGWDAILMGHCHRPLLVTQEVKGRQGLTVTVGGWNGYRSFLCYEAGLFSLKSFRDYKVTDMVPVQDKSLG
jgi:UDP-2,3-diacylglucosamine hydrolase